MRLVDADELKKKAFGKRGGLIHTRDIDDAPTVDAVPVKHGKWIDLGKDRMIRWQCSECGRKDMHIFNFCPDCGAALS